MAPSRNTSSVNTKQPKAFNLIVTQGKNIIIKNIIIIISYHRVTIPNDMRFLIIKSSLFN